MANTIIRASAGSGKTFRLSNEFLNAVFAGAPIDSILASTFTRKAAGEITDRIFTKLADVALDPAKRKEFEELEYPLHYPKSNDLEKTLQNILAELARNMYRLRVGTLDSYFNKIATAFSLELGLPPDWSMLDETEYPRLLDEAVREVFNESDRNDAKILMHLLQKGEESASMMKEIVTLAKKMLPVVRQTSEAAWEHGTEERLENHTHDLLPSEKIDELLERIEAITDDQLPQTAKKEVDSRFRNARDGIREAIRSQDWKSFLEETLVQNVAPTLNDPTAPRKYCGKDIPPEFFAIVTELLPHARSVQIKILIGQTRATYELLKMVAEKLDGIMERERKFRFEDITRKIADYGFKNRLDSLRHRLNAETKHLFLDEFQDTSLQQWEILEPLALQTVHDKKGTYFCVGDEKQSIYSWRGGEAAIFESMKSRLENESKIEKITMETTRRCAKPIIEAVNTLFVNIQNSATVLAASEKAGKRWQERFQEHDTANKNPGYCVLEESPQLEKDDSQKMSKSELEAAKEKLHIEYVVDRIKELIPIVQNRPELKNGIGVLVATNPFGAKIVSALKKHNIETAGSGASLLQSPAVRHVVSALVFAEHPGDTTARFHLAHGPLAEKIGLEKFDDSQCSHNIRNELVNRGYGEVVGDYIEVLAEFCDAVELERLEKLREVAWRFDEVSTGIRTRRFVEMLENEYVSNQNTAHVQVMTVHKAKGLEFDIVVLPQLTGNLKGRIHEDQYVTSNAVEDDPTSSIDFALRYAYDGLRCVLPKEYQAVFEHRIQREVEESLCELYVAMTRAVRSLIMIVPFREKLKDDITDAKNSNESTSFANTLRRLPREKKPSNILYQNGDPNWYENIPETAKECPVRSVDVLECNLNKNVKYHHVSRITPSKHHGQTTPAKSTKKKMTLQNSEDAAIKGVLLHACFEHGVQWIDDIQNCDENKLRERIEEILDGQVPSFSIDGILDEFRTACRKPEIVTVLSRSRYLPDKNPELERERRFAVWIENKIMRGSIDRLVIQRDIAGTIAKIEILDYKTGGSTDDFDALVETYRSQLADYRQAVCELYGVEAAIVETTLVFVTLGKVVSQTVGESP